MGSEPKLSIVVPVYGVEEYLSDCVWSILRQDFEDFEVIIVDDATADSAGKIADDFARYDARIRVVHHPVNRGLGAARNTGLSAARGEYVTFPDSDDMTTRRAYADMVSSLDRTGSDFATGPAQEFGRRRVRYWTTDGAAFDVPGERLTLNDRPGLIEDHTAWTKVFRRSFLMRHGIRWPEGVKCEDVVPSTLAYVHAEAVDVLTETVYLYRRRQGSITTNLGAGIALSDWVNESARALDVARVAPPQALNALANKILRRELLTDTRLRGLEVALPEVREAASVLTTALVEAADPDDLQLLTYQNRYQIARVISRETRDPAEPPAQSDGVLTTSVAPMRTPGLRRTEWDQERSSGESVTPPAPNSGRASPSSSAEIVGPELSVIIPTHNVAPYVDELLRSVRGSIGVNLEIIVVDDNSTDETWDRVVKHTRDDSRVRALRSPGRGGGQARNAGVASAQGTFLAFADGDDIIPPNAYRVMLDLAHAADAEIVTGKHLKFFTTSTWDPTERLYPFGDHPLVGDLADLPQLVHPRTVWNRIFRRDFWNQHALPFPGVPRANDIVPFASAITAARRVAYVPTVVYVYRDRPGQFAMTSALGSVASTVSYLSEELSCVDLYALHGSKAVSILHWRVLLSEDGWGNITRYLAARQDHEAASTQVAAWVARVLSRAPREEIRSLSPEQQVVWSLLEAGHEALAAEMYAAMRQHRPLLQSVELMRSVFSDLPHLSDRVVDYLTWKYVVRRAIDSRGALDAEHARAIIQFFDEQSLVDKFVPQPGTYETAFMDAVRGGSPDDLISFGSLAPAHPPVSYLPTTGSGAMFLSTFAPDAIAYHAVSVVRRGARNAVPVPVAIAEADHGRTHWRASVADDRLPQDGEWELWVEYESRNSIRRVRTTHTIVDGRVASKPAIEPQLVALDGTELTVSLAVNDEAIAVSAIRFASDELGHEFEASRSADGSTAEVIRVDGSMLASAPHAEFQMTAIADTGFGPVPVRLHLEATAVQTRRGPHVVIAAEGLLRILNARDDRAIVHDLFDRYLVASVSHAEIDDEQIVLSTTPVGDAIVTEFRLWRRAESRVYSRGFTSARLADGTLKSVRGLSTLEQRRWSMMVTFDTPLGPIEHPVRFTGDVVNTSTRARLGVPGGRALRIDLDEAASMS